MGVVGKRSCTNPGESRQVDSVDSGQPRSGDGQGPTPGVVDNHRRFGRRCRRWMAGRVCRLCAGRLDGHPGGRYAWPCRGPSSLVSACRPVWTRCAVHWPPERSSPCTGGIGWVWLRRWMQKVDRCDRFLEAVGSEPFELALGPLTEEALNQVEPRRRSGNEVEVNAGVLRPSTPSPARVCGSQVCRR